MESSRPYRNEATKNILVKLGMMLSNTMPLNRQITAGLCYYVGLDSSYRDGMKGMGMGEHIRKAASRRPLEGANIVKRVQRPTTLASAWRWCVLSFGQPRPKEVAV